MGRWTRLASVLPAAALAACGGDRGSADESTPSEAAAAIPDDAIDSSGPLDATLRDAPSGLADVATRGDGMADAPDCGDCDVGPEATADGGCSDGEPLDGVDAGPAFSVYDVLEPPYVDAG